MTKEIDNLLSQLKTKKEGLSSKEAEERLQTNGKNIFPIGKQKSIPAILLNQF